MLDRTFIRENLSFVQERLKTKSFELDREEFLRLDQEERSVRMEWEELRALRNRTSDEIAELKKKGEDASQKIEQMKQVSARIKELDDQLKKLEGHINEFLAVIPNLPHESVPVGLDESFNTVTREVGAPPHFDFPVSDHVDLGVNLGILDLERASKVAGARFTNYYGAGALLERALISFMLDIHIREHGYLEILPPFMANRASFFGTGNLPKFEADLFHVDGTDYFLVPTAEVPVTNVFAGEILSEEDLPINFVANTPCFRSEAGSHGKDTRGLIRQHQFNKVELVTFCKPEDSYKQLGELTSHAEEILRRLEIPYRVVTLSTGDMSFSSAKTYDLEAWIPSQNTYRELSSCSNFEDFQARRANIRYKPGAGKRTRFVHTLNGSGLAVGRTWVAIVENFQQADGSVIIPEALRPYTYGMEQVTRESFVLR
ncbi:serine--tRNA ligase [Acidobacteria bacterium AH-259-L09]|nr:serine--tRNA ligase [Acidobacteria bacterium AH-259-L09]